MVKTAKLNRDEEQVRCADCNAKLADLKEGPREVPLVQVGGGVLETVRLGPKQKLPYLTSGMKLDVDGRWRLTEHARTKLNRGDLPSFRRSGRRGKLVGMAPAEYPAIVVCPFCDKEQVFDEATLKLGLAAI